MTEALLSLLKDIAAGRGAWHGAFDQVAFRGTPAEKLAASKTRQQLLAAAREYGLIDDANQLTPKGRARLSEASRG